MKTDTATQSDLDVLTALNRDYIHSVQHAMSSGSTRSWPRTSCAPTLTGRWSTRSNSWHRPLDRSRSAASRRRKSECAFSAMSRSFTHAPATPLQTANSGMAAYRCLGAPGRKVARGIRARDEIARSKSTSASYCLQLCDLLAPGYIYAEGTLSGTAAPQASVSSRKADCQFRATMSWAQFRN